MDEIKSLFSTEKLSESDRCLHTPNDFEKQNLLYIQEVGRLESIQPHRCIREKLESFLLLIVMEGEGVIKVSETEYHVQKGNIAFIDCMEHYEHISDEERAWKLAWIHFNGGCARKYYELFMKYNKNNNIFYVDCVEKWYGIVLNILQNQKEKNIFVEFKNAEALMHILNMTLDTVVDVDALANNIEKQVLKNVREYINKYYVEQNIIELLEQTFAQNIDLLDIKFTQTYGISIRDYIINRRYNAAKELMRFSIKSIEDIAVDSGICDLSEMQNMFLMNEGMTAEEYRCKWAGWVRSV